jgi:ArsR family transcriptional regulator
MHRRWPMRWHYGGMPTQLAVLSPAPVTACCAPLAKAPLSVDQATELSRRLKALADPTRLRLLSLLMAAENGEACTCDLAGPLGVSQPTVTHHLNTLAAAGLVAGERRGVWTWYRVVREALSAVASVITPAAH